MLPFYEEANTFAKVMHAIFLFYFTRKYLQNYQKKIVIQDNLSIMLIIAKCQNYDNEFCKLLRSIFKYHY